MGERLHLACQGKTKSQGGMNMDEIVALAHNHGIVVSEGADRKQLLEALCKRQLRRTGAVKVTSVDPSVIVNPGICKSDLIQVGTGNFNEFKVKRGKLYYKGIRTELVQDGVIASGSFGIVYKAIAVVTGTPTMITLAMKVSRNNNTLDEYYAYKRHPKIKKCEHILNFKIINKKEIIMPLATGSLSDWKYGLDKSQVKTIINAVSMQLMCLFEHKIHYYDIKLDNILYYCIPHGIQVSLADLGSILTVRGNYSTTYPPPDYYEGQVPRLIDTYALKYYTYLMINVYLELIHNVTVAGWSKKRSMYTFQESLIKATNMLDVRDPFELYIKKLLDACINSDNIMPLPGLPEFLEQK